MISFDVKQNCPIVFPFIDIYISSEDGHKKNNLTIFIQDLLARELDTETGNEKVSFMISYLRGDTTKDIYDLIKEDITHEEVLFQFRCCLGTLVLLSLEKNNHKNVVILQKKEDVEQLFWASCSLGFDKGIQFFHKALLDIVFKDAREGLLQENLKIEEKMKYINDIRKLKAEIMDPILFTGLCLTKEGEVIRKEGTNVKRDSLWHEILEAV
jgi:hypothetical protein